MPRPKSPVPSYRLHKPSGQAVVTVPTPSGGRRDIYLGVYNSPESTAEYGRVLAQLRADGPRTAAGIPPTDITVSELLVEFLRHADAFPHLLGLIGASALLHGFHRETRDGAIIATSADYQIAAELAKNPFQKAGGELTEDQQAFATRVRQKYPPNQSEFSTTEARDLAKKSKATMSAWLAVLDNAGLIEQTAPSKGKVPARWKCTEKTAVETGLTVPKATDVFAGASDQFQPNAERRDPFA